MEFRRETTLEMSQSIVEAYNTAVDQFEPNGLESIVAVADFHARLLASGFVGLNEGDRRAAIEQCLDGFRDRLNDHAEYILPPRKSLSTLAEKIQLAVRQ